ncbi:hypothetical protein D3C76_1147430 [compost metagenome]
MRLQCCKFARQITHDDEQVIKRSFSIRHIHLDVRIRNLVEALKVEAHTLVPVLHVNVSEQLIERRALVQLLDQLSKVVLHVLAVNADVTQNGGEVVTPFSKVQARKVVFVERCRVVHRVS